jgi:hypothetical protein
LQQRVESLPSLLEEWMWGCLQIDRLFHQNVQLFRAVAVHLEVRQMRVEIESADAL